jgi:type III pantothenate kinase
MNVTVDLGNTLAKVGIFDHDQLVDKMILTNLGDVPGVVRKFSGGNMIVSSVNADADLLSTAAKGFKTVLTLTSETPVPVSIRYGTRGTLGVDRIAAVCGAYAEFPGQNCLVIDAGTCVTCEILDAEGNYWGGAISPGLAMRFRAMNSFTARLPLVEPVDSPPLTGNSTTSCMQSGVIYGLIDELNGSIGRYSEKFKDLRVILTGGDCRFFENKLKASIFASPELVLRGLNSILLHNIRD